MKAFELPVSYFEKHPNKISLLIYIDFRMDHQLILPQNWKKNQSQKKSLQMLTLLNSPYAMTNYLNLLLKTIHFRFEQMNVLILLKLQKE